VAKTKTRTSGRVSNRFWKLLGASTDRDQAQSMAQVRASAEFDEKAAGLDDEQLTKATKLLRLDDLADSDDIPQFLAIAREASERTTTLKPFDVQLQGALRMLAGDVVEMATGEGKTLSGAIAAATRRPTSGARPTSATSPMPRSTRSASTCCATSWSPTSMTWCHPTPMSR
jgi:preprotein translocase subunit SecA